MHAETHRRNSARSSLRAIFWLLQSDEKLICPTVGARLLRGRSEAIALPDFFSFFIVKKNEFIWVAQLSDMVIFFCMRIYICNTSVNFHLAFKS